MCMHAGRLAGGVGGRVVRAVGVVCVVPAAAAAAAARAAAAAAARAAAAPRRAGVYGGIKVYLFIVLTTEQCSVILLLAPHCGAQIWSDHVYLLRF